jgi:hypothetical protein
MSDLNRIIRTGERWVLSTHDGWLAKYFDLFRPPRLAARLRDLVAFAEAEARSPLP